MSGAPRVVVDTNVLVAALLHPDRKPARVLSLALDGQLQLLVDERILAEYEQVLLRPKFRFEAADVAQLLAVLRSICEQVIAPPLALRLPDTGDVAFVEVAVGGCADALVTGNLRDFPQVLVDGPRVVSPGELLERLASR